MYTRHVEPDFGLELIDDVVDDLGVGKVESGVGLERGKWKVFEFFL